MVPFIYIFLLGFIASESILQKDSGIVRNLPIVVWPGMGDAGNSKEIILLCKTLKKLFDLPDVIPLMIGKTETDSRMKSYFMPAKKHVEIAREFILSQPSLVDGFNIIGLSQGSQFARAYVQRYSYPSVKTLITFGGQHQGVSSFGNCDKNYWRCSFATSLVSDFVYSYLVQSHSTQSNYWHDPLMEDVYRKKCVFLPEINQENAVNMIYYQNLNRLEFFVMVMFANDTFVIPRESSHFGFYAPMNDSKIISVFDSVIYKENRLPLRDMYLRGSLKFLECPGDHMEIDLDWIEKNLANYLL